jgi:hypothetical protein
MPRTRTANNPPRTSSMVSRAIATSCTQSRDNTEKSQDNNGSIFGTATKQGYLSRQTRMPNRPLTITTDTTVPGGALQYDDVIELGGSPKYYVPDVFQTVEDRADRVPQWTGNPWPATHGASHGRADHFRKEPTKHAYSIDECRAISSGGIYSFGPDKHMPTYPADKNRY